MSIKSKEHKDSKKSKRKQKAKYIKNNDKKSETKVKSCWYYSTNDKSRKGPFPLEKLIGMVKSGDLKKDSLCWTKGMDEWKEMGEIDNFLKYFQAIEEDIKRIESLITQAPINGETGSKTKRKRIRPKKKRWKELKKHHYVYITGLPPKTDEKLLEEYFSKCGIIRRDPLTEKLKIKIYKDQEGQIKGDGLVSYLKEESVQLAIDMLDETFISPENKIKVCAAEFKMKGDVFVPNKRSVKDQSIVKKVTSKKIVQVKNQERQLCWDDEEEEELVGKAGLRIVVLKPMFSLDELKEESEDESKFYQHLGEEVGLECERVAGSIEKLTVFEGNPLGPIAIKFKSAKSAARCVKKMDERYFSGRKISCDYFDGTDYRIGHIETEEEKNKRIEEFGDWLEGKGEN